MGNFKDDVEPQVPEVACHLDRLLCDDPLGIGPAIFVQNVGLKNVVHRVFTIRGLGGPVGDVAGRRPGCH